MSHPANDLTVDELAFIFNNGYTIRQEWISPMEGFEYKVLPLGGAEARRTGGSDVLATRKSVRAAYNYIVRLCSAGGLGRESEPQANGIA